MKVHQAKRRAIAVASVVTAMSLVGCASTTANNPKDPFESFNRTMFSVNEGIDTVVKPVAQGYADYVPSPIRTGIGNNYLQGKITEGSSDVSRVIVNTTMGVGGLFDVATHLDLEKHNEDFGQTLGVWGVGTGPYLFWPFIGPRDVRDTFGFLADTYTDPVWRVNNVPVRNSAVVVRFNGTASLVNSSLKPLLDACDFLRLKGGIVYGYQRRPHSAAPVLVAVVQPIRWSSHFLKQVES